MIATNRNRKKMIEQYVTNPEYETYYQKFFCIGFSPKHEVSSPF